ncbi:cubilin-like [Haliotis asinina]|uniref:cubilin-like n=1 Tax=Haliotis asinina TaxID=109174 RepID=UPI003531DCEE
MEDCSSDSISVYNGNTTSAGSCNLTLMADSKPRYFVSPGYPTAYGNNEQCTWTLTADSVSGQVRVIVTDSHLEGGAHCQFDYVKAFDGKDINSPLLDTWCQITRPTLTSTGRSLTLMFKTDDSTTNDGFNITYFQIRAPCSNSTVVVTPSFINITSPNYPNQYPSNLDCGWTLRARDPGNIVAIGIADLSVAWSQNCSTAGLEVYDGADRTAPIINIFCGSLKDSIASSGDSLFLRFHSGTGSQGHGFRVVALAMPECTGNLTATSNVQALSSPFFPDNYFSNLHCKWTITADVNRTIIINVGVAQIQPSTGCTADSLTVYNGNATTASNLLGSSCRDDDPTYQTGINKAVIVFETDNYFVMMGFNLTYKSVPSSSCSTFLVAFDSYPYYLVSPGYPNAYYNNLDCAWTIFIASSLDKIELEVVSSDVEGPYPACGHDVVTVYSGIPPDGIKVGEFCGNTTNTTIFTTYTTAMRLSFKTNSAVVRRGFKLRYSGFSGTGPTNPPPPSLPCGKANYTLSDTSTNYTLTSPGYPKGYNGKANCPYSITGPPNTMIHVKVTDSSLSTGPFCDSAYVNVYDGKKLLTVWCSRQKPEFQTTGNQLNLRFIANGSSRYKGFNLTYFATTAPYSCGNQLTASTTTDYLRSPNYPLGYQNNEDCQWKITTSEKNIRVEFIEMSLQGGRNCDHDYVAVYDGSSTSTQMLGKLCSTATPSFTSSGSSVFIHFHTDASESHNGFKIKYTAGNFSVCGKTDLKASDFISNIKSPEYPYYYPRNTECVWKISADSGFTVRLAVSESSLTNSSGCVNDYVQVYDGPSVSSASLGRFCGIQTPTYISSGRYMTVKFHSNGVNSDKGFKLLYTSDFKPSVTRSTSTSPLLGRLCWSNEITYLSSGNSVFIQFRTDGQNEHRGFKLELAESTDRITVVDELGTFCGNATPAYTSNNWGMVVEFRTNGNIAGKGFRIQYQSSGPYRQCNSTEASELSVWCADMAPTVQSTGQSMTIVFQTDRSITSSGFQLEYFQTNEQYTCGGHVNASDGEGYLTSPGYPDSHDRNRYCEWTIQTSKNDTILNITVVDSRMDDSVSCNHDGVKVTDGISSNSSLLGEFCGNMKPTYLSSGPAITLGYSIGSENITRGFKIKYTPISFSACNRLVLATPDLSNVTSLNYPNEYPENTYCWWIFRARDPKNVVVVEVTDMSIKKSPNCARAFLSFYNGISNHNKLIKKFCGDTKGAVSSSGDVMYATFQTLQGWNGTGFRLVVFEMPNSIICTTLLIIKSLVVIDI